MAMPPPLPDASPGEAPKGPSDRLSEPRKRRLHTIDFRGKPAWLRVPTALEAIEAEVGAAKWLAGQVSPDVELDPELWTVSTATAFILGRSFVDRDGAEMMTGRLMLEAHSQDELVELLHHLNAARAAESKNPPLVDDDEVEQLAVTLAGCNELNAYAVCAGMNHEAMVRLALGLSRLLSNQTTEAARVAPLDDLATT
jgi:hypothetical protein